MEAAEVLLTLYMRSFCLACRAIELVSFRGRTEFEAKSELVNKGWMPDSRSSVRCRYDKVSAHDMRFERRTSFFWPFFDTQNYFGDIDLRQWNAPFKILGNALDAFVALKPSISWGKPWFDVYIRDSWLQMVLGLQSVCLAVSQGVFEVGSCQFLLTRK